MRVKCNGPARCGAEDFCGGAGNFLLVLVIVNQLAEGLSGCRPDRLQRGFAAPFREEVMPVGLTQTADQSDSLIGAMLRLQDANCHLEESEKILRLHQKFPQLVTLYESKGLHKNGEFSYAPWNHRVADAFDRGLCNNRASLSKHSLCNTAHNIYLIYDFLIV